MKISKRITTTQLRKKENAQVIKCDFGPKWKSETVEGVEKTAKKPQYDAFLKIEPKRGQISIENIHNSDIFKINKMGKEEILELAKELVHKLDHQYDHLKNVIYINRVLDESIWEEDLVTVFDCVKKLKQIWLEN